MGNFANKNLTDWHQLVESELKGGSSEDLIWDTPEEISIKPLYTAADLEGLEMSGQMPGFAPFSRGVRATMYANRPWTIRQYAGFSTAEEVTDISGRGIGMSAVKEEIEKLGGSISVSSKIDEGTEFIIKLPLLH